MHRFDWVFKLGVASLGDVEAINTSNSHGIFGGKRPFVEPGFAPKCRQKVFPSTPLLSTENILVQKIVFMKHAGVYLVTLYYISCICAGIVHV